VLVIPAPAITANFAAVFIFGQTVLAGTVVVVVVVVAVGQTTGVVVAVVVVVVAQTTGLAAVRVKHNRTPVITMSCILCKMYFQIDEWIMIMKSDMHLPFIGILSTLDMRRFYFKYTGRTTEVKRVEISTARIFLRHVSVSSIPVETKIFFVRPCFFCLNFTTGIYIV
jgi:hypothetical protein